MWGHGVSMWGHLHKNSQSSKVKVCDLCVGLHGEERAIVFGMLV